MQDKNGPNESPAQDGQGAVTDARFLNSRAWVLRWADRKQSRSLAKEAIRLCQSQPKPDTQGIGLATRTLAWQAKWVGDFDEAHALCRRAMSRIPPECNPAEHADVLSILGVVHYSRGRRDLAAEVTRKGLELIDKVDAPSTRIDLLTTLATIKRYNGHMYEAYEALQTARNLSSRGERARVDHNLARCLEQDNNPGRAVGYAMRSVIGARRHNNRVILPYALEVLGVTLGQMHNLDLAMTYLREGLAIAVEDEDHRARCQILEQIGHLHDIDGKVEDALTALSCGLKLAETLDYPIWQRKFLRRIANIERGRDNHAAAVAAFSKLVDLIEAERA